ncbi:hypothetical protein QBC47DRAFT_109067 [Echria macrotheca]|uniref:Uncharacterized protein n=1 Tax=Echria macrotheca TaxID=438768 RepID=A0AAJ0F9W8_9PEZI|nr:hypothetical protein QBC47DRAFT_109067 [Echria macrotheca]
MPAMLFSVCGAGCLLHVIIPPIGCRGFESAKGRKTPSGLHCILYVFLLCALVAAVTGGNKITRQLVVAVVLVGLRSVPFSGKNTEYAWFLCLQWLWLPALLLASNYLVVFSSTEENYACFFAP